MDAKLLSIVTPVFNCVKYIEESVQSVIIQKCNKVEYIVFDGCSNDGTVDLIKKHIDFIDVFVSEHDHGQSDALNKAIKRASGKYILWLNADDYLPFGIIDKLVNALEVLPSNNALIGCLKTFTNDGRFCVNRPEVEKINLNYLLNYSGISINNIIYPKEHFEKNGYFLEDFHYTFDYENCLRLAVDYEFIFLDEIIYNFRKHQEAKSTKNYIDFIWEMIKIRKIYQGKLFCEINMTLMKKIAFYYFVVVPFRFIRVDIDNVLFKLYSKKGVC